ncbi:2,3-dihydro-2,3-dihydroxybenzoate dehydrogenase [Aquabacterium sp.]|uniref:2,3-dihydro-2,3-dihydroxybenzoate dehydrogenase n=1 Tax=Aquabacterium sp. TaxID=1872578 RepID=UPI0040379508
MNAAVNRFEGRVAMVTGAGQGIGLAVVEMLVEQRARVAMLDLPGAALAEQARRLSLQGSPVMACEADVRRADSLGRAVSQVMALWGQIDILINVAGVLHAGSFVESTEQEWAQTFDVNAQGVFRVCAAVVPHMIARGQGAIVTVGSNAATTPRINMAAYAASKAASAQFTRCLGLELAPHGIRCNIVSPGSTDTAMQRALWRTPDALSKVIGGDLLQHRLGIPLGRIASPRDVAMAVCYLASDEARHITMHDLRVDGGATLDA